MAMRPRGGSGGSGGVGSRRGTRTGAVQSVYEDFKPVSEWQQDDESHHLNISLPGFMKEQIRVTTKGRNTIRVRGERLVTGNKWSRFSKDFHVPENGELNSVHAKFHGGILIITVPKERASKPQDPLPSNKRDVDDIRKQPTPQKGGQVKAITEVKGTGDPQTKRGHDGTQKQPIQKLKIREDEIRKQPKTQKGQVKAIQEVKGGVEKQKGADKPLTEVGTSQSTEEKSLEPVKASTERDLDDDRRGRSFTPSRSTRNEEESSENQRGRSFTPTKTTGNVISQNVERKDVASEKPQDMMKEKVHKEGKATMGGSEFPEVERVNKKESEKSQDMGIPEKTANNKDSYKASKQQNYKKAVKGLTELNEERQLLVNMGVAVLVIVALTAYVTHSFASAKHKN